MLSGERRNVIIGRVQAVGSVSVHELAELCQVTEATIRRDLGSLQRAGHLERFHGGAVGRGIPVMPAPREDQAPVPHLDGLILAPVQENSARALRERLQRRGAPVVAESAPQPGLPYVGPDDYAAGLDLGRWTANELNKRRRHPRVLCVTHRHLANTQMRSKGFVEGLRQGMASPPEVYNADGGGLYSEAYEAARDALRSHPEVNAVFGVNDDSILAAIQAHRDLGCDPRDLIAVSIGVEGRTLLEALAQGAPLRASVALFPEVVGARLVDAVVSALAGDRPEPIPPTPHALLTPRTLGEHYRLEGGHWQPVSAPPPARKPGGPQAVGGRRIGFVIGYSTHEWYQNLARSMRQRAQQFGIEFEVLDVRKNLRSEVRELRRMVGKFAAQMVGEGERVILDASRSSVAIAQFLHGKRGISVLTNSLEVFDELRNDPALDLRLVGGEVDRKAQALVGRAACNSLENQRADKVFLSAAGLTERFGVSSLDEREAEVRLAMALAAREVIVLADHTAIGYEANHKVIGLDRVHTLITDAGVEPDKALALRNLGVKVVIAGEMNQ